MCIGVSATTRRFASISILLEFVWRDMHVVPEIEARGLAPLLGARLVDAEHLLCGVQEDVGRRVVAHQRPPAFLIHHPFHPLAAFQGLVTRWRITSPTLSPPSTRTMLSDATRVPVSDGWPPPSGSSR